MKKKIISICLIVALLAVGIVGATLAYFTDTDTQKNTFTVGNVTIDLWEDFGSNSGIEKLLPATGSWQAGTLENGINKDVYVTNTGSETAYVRVHIAIPSVLDNGDPSFDAGKNVLHFNPTKATLVTGQWNWGTKIVEGRDSFYGTGDKFNYYETTIDGVPYNVYVVTYEGILAKNATTPDAITNVYLDSKVTNEDITKIINGVTDEDGEATQVGLGDNWYIYVVAEGCQTDGFDDAFEALNTSFGKPGTYTVNFKASAEGQTFKTATPAAD